MATRKGTDPEPGPMANQPKVQAQLRQLAKVEASRVTGVPISEIGKTPVAGKNTSKGKKKASK